MGCGPQPKPTSLKKADTLVGILKVNVKGYSFPPEQQVKSPTIKLRVSNQQSVVSSLGSAQTVNKVNKSFNFAINSFYKGEGRSIQVGVFENDNLLAYGAVDANPFITSKGQTIEFRCIMAAAKNKKFGHILLQAVFQELPYTQITFRFESATIRKKQGSSVAVKLTIGQQQLQTNYQIETPQKPPIWKDQMFNFKVPQGIKTGFLELIDGNGNEIGSGTLQLSKLFENNPGDEIFVAEQLFFKEEGKDIDAANLKYSYIIGSQAAFTVVNDILRSSVRAVRSKNQLDETIISRPAKE